MRPLHLVRYGEGKPEATDLLCEGPLAWDSPSLRLCACPVATQACQARGIPVVFDEVFAGLYRLGAISAASLLRIVSAGRPPIFQTHTG